MDRQHNLDNLKFIAAFLVICIHMNLSRYGVAIHAIARVAVPIFLMISGYFYPIMRQKCMQWGYLKKIIWMMFWSSIFYFIVTLVYNTNALPLCFNFIDCVKFIIINEYIPYTSEHLWYFSALICTICLINIEYRYIHYFYLLIPVLLICAYVISSITTNYLYYRNFLFTALPYFLLGCYVRKYDEKLKCLCESKLSSVTNFVLLLIFEIILLCSELFLYKNIGLPICRDIYFITPLLVLTIFIGALYVFPNNEVKYISYIGSRYSAYIYIFHMFVKIILEIFLDKFVHVDFSKMYFFNVFMTFVFTIVFVYLFLKSKSVFLSSYLKIVNKLRS